MAYTKTYPGGWLEDKTTPITAASLENIEDGIIALEGQSVGGWISKAFTDTGDPVAAFDKVFVDTTGGAFNLVLPATPTEGDTVKFVDATGNFATATFTITVPAGDYIMGNLNGTLDLVANYDFVDVTYYAADDTWIITGKP